MSEHQTDVETRLNATDKAGLASPDQSVCQFCEKPYTPKRERQRFCSTRCRVASWNAAHPRFDLGQIKFKEKDRKPTVADLQAAGFKVGGKR